MLLKLKRLSHPLERHCSYCGRISQRLSCLKKSSCEFYWAPSVKSHQHKVYTALLLFMHAAMSVSSKTKSVLLSIFTLNNHRLFKKKNNRSSPHCNKLPRGMATCNLVNLKDKISPAVRERLSVKNDWESRLIKDHKVLQPHERLRVAPEQNLLQHPTSYWCKGWNKNSVYVCTVMLILKDILSN